MSALPSLRLLKDLRQAIRRGHPWIYNRACEAPKGRPGELVALTYQGERVAVGFADPDGPIAVRVVSVVFPAMTAEIRIDASWAQARAYAAARRRVENPFLTGTDAVRAIHGEGDLMPGLVVDLYGDTAVVVFDGAAAAAFWSSYMAAVRQGMEEAGLAVARMWARPVKGAAAHVPYARGGVIHGEAPPATLVVREDRARFEVDVRHGQKTGLFLDQRQNRRLLAELASGGRVLNLFAYTGGFSVHAALGGAAQVTSVDIAAPAMAAAERNFSRSGISPHGHRFVTEDVFAFLERAVERDHRYDIVVVDPPSFAPSERAKPKAMGAYERLNSLAARVVGRGGLLFSASCSSHITMADMRQILASTSKSTGRSMRVVTTRGASVDHPVLPGFPEGEYLKLLVVSVA